MKCDPSTSPVTILRLRHSSQNLKDIEGNVLFKPFLDSTTVFSTTNMVICNENVVDLLQYC